MRTTRPTDDDLRVIIQTLAVSGSLGEDDGIALLREIDALSYDLEAAEARAERYRVALREIVDQAEYAPEDAPDIARDALAAGEGADA
jgi:hypothetical protein